MTESIVFALQIVKVIAIVAGAFGLFVVLGMMVDLLREEWAQKRKERRAWKEIPYTTGVIRHRHRAKHERITREFTIWERYFFTDISPDKINKDTPFTHPYIARNPRLHRYVIRMEPVSV